jgi:hypothetical protein
MTLHRLLPNVTYSTTTIGSFWPDQGPIDCMFSPNLLCALHMSVVHGHRSFRLIDQTELKLEASSFFRFTLIEERKTHTRSLAQGTSTPQGANRPKRHYALVIRLRGHSGRKLHDHDLLSSSRPKSVLHKRANLIKLIATGEYR